jgi:NAD-dependent deacetylase
MKNIVFFTGSGISAESGVSTFRDIKDGLWYNYEVDKVATKEGWKKDRELVLEFHNMLRKKLHDVKPNQAHNSITKLESKYNVNTVTQNVDDLHERSGSKNVYHIHGELFKCRSSLNPNLIYDCRGSIDIGDKCEKGSQLRPHTVLFGEYPNNIDTATQLIRNADILVIIGCSFEIVYTPDLVMECSDDCDVYYIDPSPSDNLRNEGVTFIKEKAIKGMEILIDKYLD